MVRRQGGLTAPQPLEYLACILSPCKAESDEVISIVDVRSWAIWADDVVQLCGVAVQESLVQGCFRYRDTLSIPSITLNADTLSILVCWKLRHTQCSMIVVVEISQFFVWS